MSELNLDFIRRAERVTSFNLTASDFQTLQYKPEIQHLINKHFFPKFDLKNTIRGVDKNKLNRLIETLKSQNPTMLKALHQYPLKGVGPGEALMYFLIDDAHLGGGSSAGVDLVVKSSGSFEIKAVNVTTDGFATNFKTGGTFPIADLVKRALDLQKASGGSGSEVNLSSIEKIKKQNPGGWDDLENDYRERTYENYFKSHDIIFINNAGRNMSNIAEIKRVQKKDIFFERVTSGVIKPKVKL